MERAEKIRKVDRKEERKERVKYPKLIGVCKDCVYKCFRVENPNFTGDKNCKYAEKENWKQERIKI